MKYDQDAIIREKVAQGRHRQVIGGMWEELGKLQLTFLKDEGLQPHHRLVDVGCGSLRAGVPLTRYLEPGHYYGVDIQQCLLDAGYRKEIKRLGLQDRLPRKNLHATGDFDLSPFSVMFDYAIAQSVFSHMAVDNLTRCLEATAPWFKPGARFYATYFERPENAAPDEPVRHEPGGVTTYPDRDPFDVTASALAAATPAGWRLEVVGDWGHPRDQRMARFVRE